MSKPFEREARYVVLKGTDIAQFLTEQEQHRLKNLMATVAQWRVKSGKAPLDVFVLESDWPEFDIAVDMVRRRMEGRPTREAAHLHAIDTLTEKVTVLEKSLAVMDREHMDVRELFDLKKGEQTIPAITAFLDLANAEILGLRDYQTKAGAVILNLKEKLKAAQDIAEAVFVLAEVAPELNRSDIDHDAACQLDTTMIEIHGILKDYLVGSACGTCGGSGSIGGCSGQTPESYQEETYPCPDCAESTVITSSGRQPGMQTMRDLAMLVKQLCRRLAATDPAFSAGLTESKRKANTELAMKAMDYLKRKGLMGPPLREGDDSAPWVDDWTARVPLRTLDDGKYVKWEDHLAKLQELLKDHGDAALQEIDRLLNENAELTADRDKWQGKAHALNQEMISPKKDEVAPVWRTEVPDSVGGWWRWNGDPEGNTIRVDVVMRSYGGEKHAYILQFSDWAANIEGGMWCKEVPLALPGEVEDGA